MTEESATMGQLPTEAVESTKSPEPKPGQEVEKAVPQSPAQVAVSGQVDASSGLDFLTLGKVMAASGYFSVKNQAQAVVKMLYGKELGIGPVAAMMGVYVTEQGKIGLHAALMASLIKRSRKYDYRVRKLEDECCEIEFSEHGETLTPIAVFTLADAKRAGLLRNQTYERYPKNMMWARAMSNGARWHCAQVFNGPVYSREELEEEERLEREAAKRARAVTADAPAPVPEDLIPLFDELGWPQGKREMEVALRRHWTPESVREWLMGEVTKMKGAQPAPPDAVAPTGDPRQAELIPR